MDIQALFVDDDTGGWAWEPENISQKGFPNCKRSSDALTGCGGGTLLGAPPNKSTIGCWAVDPVDKNGFVLLLVGDCTLAWEKKKKKN